MSSQLRKMSPVHPGEVLALEFLEPLNLSQYRLAQAIHVPPRRINEIVLAKRAITADTALRLGRFFGNSAQFWMNLQSRYELELAEDRLGSGGCGDGIPRARPLAHGGGAWSPRLRGDDRLLPTLELSLVDVALVGQPKLPPVHCCEGLRPRPAPKS